MFALDKEKPFAVQDDPIPLIYNNLNNVIFGVMGTGFVVLILSIPSHWSTKF